MSGYLRFSATDGSIYTQTKSKPTVSFLSLDS